MFIIPCVLTEDEKHQLVRAFHDSYYNTEQDTKTFATEFYRVVGFLYDGWVPVKLDFLVDWEDEILGISSSYQKTYESYQANPTSFHVRKPYDENNKHHNFIFWSESFDQWLTSIPDHEVPEFEEQMYQQLPAFEGVYDRPRSWAMTAFKKYHDSLSDDDWKSSAKAIEDITHHVNKVLKTTT